ncbi:MAG: hypothetical protein IPM66_05680 [Acidobacteriota bacterium]|nr:MAG: hypothetical protein IPM66_05680 [Acidobacteriota bacterium]
MKFVGPVLLLSLIFLIKSNDGLIHALGAGGGAPTQTKAGSGVNVLTHHNDNRRTGANLNETILNSTNVNSSQFGKLFSRDVDGYVYAQPLYVSGIEFPDGEIRNAVYVATERNSVYAFDADDAEAEAPLWRVNLGTPVPSTDIAENYRDLIPEVGITSTPVIDPAGGTIYIVAKSRDLEGGTWHQRLHALDIATGEERAGSPVEITAVAAGMGAGSVDGVIRFDPLFSLNRPGLLLLNGVVYLAFGSHGGHGDYHGWLMGYDAGTLEQVAVFNTTPDGIGGSIWQSGQGPAVDDNGNIYVITGNGPFDVHRGGRNYGDSVLKFSTANGLELVDSFTPRNADVLEELDIDLGSGGPVLLPGINRLIFTGKDTLFRVLDSENLGGFDPEIDRVVQQFQVSTRRMFSAPVYRASPVYGPVIYYWAGGDFLKVMKLIDGRFLEFPLAQSNVENVRGISNASPLSLSADGSKPGTGIVWATASTEGDANRQTVPGVLRAIDADDVTRELWNSLDNIDRDDVGNFAKFCPPTVANGKVYVATFSGKLHVYGLLPGVCNYGLEDPVRILDAGYDGGSFEISVEKECGWLATTDDDWIAITSDAGGNGSGSVTYSVSPNPGGFPRTGRIKIAGMELIVRQAGAASVVSAASFEGRQLAADMIATAFGEVLAMQTASADVDLPLSLQGTSVRITDSTGNELFAPLFHVSPGQVNFLIPPEISLGDALIRIWNGNDEVSTAEIEITRVAPGIFSGDASGQGVAAGVVLRIKVDGSQSYEPVARYDPDLGRHVLVPIDLRTETDQVYLLLFGTGVRGRSMLSGVAAGIAGTNVEVLYAGAQGVFAGLDQINLRLDRGLIGQGEADVMLMVDGRAANMVRISIR